ncbi:SDR family NAD(P)-dependent oxidoreductase [Streptomyces sp. NPDC001796]|uniref:SDR family NAD(P)-dependent oxidoreductase n=1 Tax=Streptomyces sp. NPDC001796 TaxID=3364609 RepID=UPI0036C159DC
MAASRAALVTGCSTGIGRAAALRLHAAGLPVHATARDPGTLDALTAQGIHTLRLDVTDEESMVTAVKRITEDHGAVGVLVNNAGSAVHGTVEDVPLDTVRPALETNVFGQIRLIQLVLPGMRAQHTGRIVKISSILGRFSPPGGGLYHATKHPLEAYADTLHVEVAPFDVRVSLIEPATVRTQFFTTAIAQFAGRSDSAYQAFYDKLAAWAIDVHEGRTAAGQLALTSEAVARVVERAAVSRRPRARYPVGLLARGALGLRRALPDAAFDKFVARQFPAP